MSNSVLLEDVGPGEELPGFDIDDPVLPPEIAAKALRSGGYPYDKRMKRKEYREQVEPLQVEFVKLQRWVERQGQRIVIIFEGRDAAGKGGTINKFTQHLNPRHARAVALAKPDEVERGQWYFQRYVEHLPSTGNMILFDRSWYNRAGVERVMGFCTDAQAALFLAEAPHFEAGLGPRRHHSHQALADRGTRDAAQAVSFAAPPSAEALEAHRHRHRRADQMGGLQYRARRHFPRNPHRRRALDGGEGQRQAAGAAQCHARRAVGDRLCRQGRFDRRCARPANRRLRPGVLRDGVGPGQVTLLQPVGTRVSYGI